MFKPDFFRRKLLKKQVKLVLTEETMKRKIINSFIVVIICLLILSFGCSQNPPYTQHSLPSGRTIKVSGIGKMYFSKDDPALMLKYFTDINISDVNALRKEVDEIWPTFMIDVEKSGLKSAIISAHEMPKGIISKTMSYNFIFFKQADGFWKMKD
jgi:hypothetical protein